MAIGSNTANINMGNIAFQAVGTSGASWQSTEQVIPLGMNDNPEGFAGRLRDTLPQVNNLRVLFNDYSFNADGSLHPQYERFLVAAAAEGFTLTVLYSGGDVQNIGLRQANGQPIVDGGGITRTPLTNSAAYSALQTQQTETVASWTKMMNWMDGHPSVKSAVYGYEVMNEPAGYRHSVDANGTSEGLSRTSFVKLYADHAIALSSLIQSRSDGKILVGGWGYSGDFATLDNTTINGASALNYLRAGVGADLVWSAHLYPGWGGTGNAVDPTDVADRLTGLYSALTGDNVLITETNAAGDVENPNVPVDNIDYFVAAYEWFADNGMGLGWFPLNNTGASNLITIEAARNVYKHQGSFAQAMNAFSLDEAPIEHAGNEVLVVTTASAKLRNEDYEIAAGQPTFDTTDRIGYAFGYGGNDTLTGTDASNDFIYGGTGNDSLDGLGADDFVFGQDGNDTLVARGNDHLFGGRGDDNLTSTGARDFLSGGAGNDIYVVNDLLDMVREYARGGTDTVRTSLTSYSLANIANVEHLTALGSVAFTGTGNTLANLIIGAIGADTLSGGEGNDTLIGNAGADRLNGDAGIDFASYQNAIAGVRADLATPATNTGEASGDIYALIEGLIGSGLNDTLLGTSGANTLIGGVGNDLLEGRGGADSFDGGSGVDTVSYASATTSVTANLTSSASNTGQAAGNTYNLVENLTGSNFADSLTGTSTANILNGGGGNDTLIGLDGSDILFGGAGNDTLSGDAGADTLRGGAGADSLVGGSGSDFASYFDAAIAVNADLIVGRSVLVGDALGDLYSGIENLEGGAFNDTLRGDDLANILLGQSGDDRLWARGGNDTMTGGAGADVFNFASAYDADVITDFANDIDEISLAGFGFTSVGQAQANATQSGANVIYNFGAGDTLTILNITIAALGNDIII